MGIKWHKRMSGYDPTFQTPDTLKLTAPNKGMRWVYEGRDTYWYYLRKIGDAESFLWASRCTVTPCPKHYVAIGLMETDIAYWVDENEVSDAIAHLLAIHRLGLTEVV
jgi:hypothetical protein